MMWILWTVFSDFFTAVENEENLSGFSPVFNSAFHRQKSSVYAG